MFKKGKINERGFTLVEVLISLAIAAFIVGPISLSLLSAIKMRLSAESIDQVTKTTERLMEDVKSALTYQIYNKQEVEGQRKVAIDEVNDKLALQGYKQCLLANSDPTFVTVNRSEAFPLEAFLNFNPLFTPPETVPSINLQEAYDTDHYAYEVALWRVEDITFEGEQLLLTPTQMNAATKLYTDSTYKWSTGKGYDAIVYPLSFQMSSEMLKLFEDADQKYAPGATPSPIKLLDTKEVKVQSNGSLDMPKATVGNVKLESKAIINAGQNKGYTIKVSLIGAEDPLAYPHANTRINIEVDIREIIGDVQTLKADAQSGVAVNTKTLKFINETKYDLVIRVKDNLPRDLYTSSEVDYMDKNKKVNDYIDKKYNIVVVASSGESGKSTIVKKADIEPCGNYMIAIIVREKDPALGQSGKIIKKMIDVYSYDVITANRR